MRNECKRELRLLNQGESALHVASLCIPCSPTAGPTQPVRSLGGIRMACINRDRITCFQAGNHLSSSAFGMAGEALPKRKKKKTHKSCMPARYVQRMFCIGSSTVFISQSTMKRHGFGSYYYNSLLYNPASALRSPNPTARPEMYNQVKNRTMRARSAHIQCKRERVAERQNQ